NKEIIDLLLKISPNVLPLLQVSTLKILGKRFTDHDEYMESFKPLIIEEFFRQIESSFSELDEKDMDLFSDDGSLKNLEKLKMKNVMTIETINEISKEFLEVSFTVLLSNNDEIPLPHDLLLFKVFVPPDQNAYFVFGRVISSRQKDDDNPQEFTVKFSKYTKPFIDKIYSYFKSSKPHSSMIQFLKISNTSTFQRELNAIESIRGSPLCDLILSPTLKKNQKLFGNKLVVPPNLKEYFNAELNHSQKVAIEESLLTDVEKLELSALKHDKLHPDGLIANFEGLIDDKDSEDEKPENTGDIVKLLKSVIISDTNTPDNWVSNFSDLLNQLNSMERNLEETEKQKKEIKEKLKWLTNKLAYLPFEQRNQLFLSDSKISSNYQTPIQHLLSQLRCYSKNPTSPFYKLNQIKKNSFFSDLLNQLNSMERNSETEKQIKEIKQKLKWLTNKFAYLPFEQRNQLFLSDSKISSNYQTPIQDLLVQLRCNKNPTSPFYKSNQIKKNSFDKLESTLKYWLAGAKIRQYGSFFSGISLNESEIDVCLFLKKNDKTLLSQVKYILKDTKNYTIVEISKRAKVPTLRFNEKTTNIHFDMCFNKRLEIYKSLLIKEYVDLDPRCRDLILLVKHWATQKNIKDASRGTFSSFCLTLMVINFLQTGVSPPILPNLESPNKSILEPTSNLKTNFIIEEYLVQYYDHTTLKFKSSDNKLSIDQLFYQFFKYYLGFDFKNLSINISKGIKQRGRKPETIEVQDLFEPKSSSAGIKFKKYKKIIFEFALIEFNLRTGLKKLEINISFVKSSQDEDCLKTILVKLFNINDVTLCGNPIITSYYFYEGICSNSNNKVLQELYIKGYEPTSRIPSPPSLVYSDLSCFENLYQLNLTFIAIKKDALGVNGQKNVAKEIGLISCIFDDGIIVSEGSFLPTGQSNLSIILDSFSNFKELRFRTIKYLNSFYIYSNAVPIFTNLKIKSCHLKIIGDLYLPSIDNLGTLNQVVTFTFSNDEEIEFPKQLLSTNNIFSRLNLLSRFKPQKEFIGNNIYGANGPKSLPDLSSYEDLVNIQLTNTGFSGPIPESYCLFTNYLTYNNLNGTLPMCKACYLNPNYDDFNNNPNLDFGVCDESTIIPNFNISLGKEITIYGENIGLILPQIFNYPIAFSKVKGNSMFKGKWNDSWGPIPDTVVVSLSPRNFTFNTKNLLPSLNNITKSNLQFTFHGSNFSYNKNDFEIKIANEICLISSITFNKIICNFPKQKNNKSGEFISFTINTLKDKTTIAKKCPNQCIEGICSINTGTCICNPGYSGETCSPIPCKSDCGTPEGRGECNYNIGVCVCNLKWKGESCEIPNQFLTSASSTLSSGGLVNLFGWFGSPNEGLTITIGSLNCQKYYYNTTFANCTIGAGSGTKSIKIIQNNQEWNGENLFHYTEITYRCPKNCSLNGVAYGECNSSLGQCKCFSGWGGYDFFKHNLSNKWIGIGDTDKNSHKFNQNISETCRITYIIEDIQEPRDYEFAGLKLTLEKDSIKLTVTIDNYPFTSALNKLQLRLESLVSDNGANIENNQCNNKDTSIEKDLLDSNQLLNYITISRNEKVLNGRFINRVLSDQRQSFITTSLISNTTTTENKESFIIGLNLPYFTESLIIDPDFSVLVSPSFKKCKSNDRAKWVLPVAIVVPCVAVATIIIISAIIYKKNHTTVLLVKNKFKLKSLSKKKKSDL
ncbi:hypothetical protein DICPUDRAFT_85060, partial [Dictyostelium purpureum]